MTHVDDAHDLSVPARRYFSQPGLVGTFPADDPNAYIAQVEEPVSGACLQLSVQIRQQTVQAVRFKAYGCAWTVACGAWSAAFLTGKSVEEVAQLSHHTLINALAIPAAKYHCAVLAERAWQAVLEKEDVFFPSFPP